MAVVAVAAAWGLIADDKKPWAILSGALAVVLSAFAPGFVDSVRGAAARRTERAGLVAGLQVIELSSSVAWLLHPDVEVVRFFGRTATLQRLSEWCADQDRAAVVQLLVGGAGYGKSRLARRFSETLGWTHWRVHYGSEEATVPARRRERAETPAADPGLRRVPALWRPGRAARRGGTGEPRG